MAQVRYIIQNSCHQKRNTDYTDFPIFRYHFHSPIWLWFKISPGRSVYLFIVAKFLSSHHILRTECRTSHWVLIRRKGWERLILKQFEVQCKQFCFHFHWLTVGFYYFDSAHTLQSFRMTVDWTPDAKSPIHYDWTALNTTQLIVIFGQLRVRAAPALHRALAHPRTINPTLYLWTVSYFDQLHFIVIWSLKFIYVSLGG